MTLRHRDVLSVLDLGRDLVDLMDSGLDFRAEAARRLCSLLNADISAYTELDTATGQAHVSLPSENQQSVDDQVVGETLIDNPIAAYCMAEERPGPVRVSDLISRRQWLATSTYALVLAPLGTPFMLGLPITLAASGGPSYAFSRGARDFTPMDVELCTYAHVAMTVVHRHEEKAKEQPIGVHGSITARERDVLALLDAGLPAQRIARDLDISTRTVHKHLEHLYAKLDVQDRLSAVNAAYGLGLLHRRGGR